MKWSYGEETAPDPEGAQAPPPEGSEDARGDYSPPGTFSGEIVTYDMKPSTLGPRRGPR